MKTEIDSIVSSVNAKNTHRDVLNRVIHPGDVVAVLISANTKKEQLLMRGIVEVTDATYIKVIDYDTFYTDERFYLGRAITGKQCCIINNELSKDELNKISEQFKKPFEKFYSYIFAYKINNDFYCLQNIMLKGKASENTIKYAVKVLQETHKSDEVFFYFLNKGVNNLHILAKDLSFVNVNSKNVDYSNVNNNFISPSNYKSSTSCLLINTNPIFCKINDTEHIYRNNWWCSSSDKKLISYSFDTENFAADARLGYLDSNEKLLIKAFIDFCKDKTK